MSNLPKHLKYTKTHEWAALEEDHVVRVGITDYAQEELGDLVYIELPEVGKEVQREEQCAVVESVKTASDLFSPVHGKVSAVNDTLNDAPEKVNEDAYENWLFCIQADDITELEGLMDAVAYSQMIED